MVLANFPRLVNLKSNSSRIAYGTTSKVVLNLWWVGIMDKFRILITKKNSTKDIYIGALSLVQLKMEDLLLL